MKPTSVYQYFGSTGALLYVGVTDRGTRRLHEHADSKPWWHLATGCTLEHYPSRELALAREMHLIQTYRPPFNHQHNPDRAKPLAGRLPVNLNDWAAGVSALLPQQSLKARRAAWYELEKASRLIAPCVRCGTRPGITGPECLNCRQGRIDSPEVKASIEALEEFSRAVLAKPRVLASEHRRLHWWAAQLGRPCGACSTPNHAPSTTPDPLAS